MEPTTDYLHHVNAACRAARSYPHLYASRLLMNLRDSDVPSSYMSRYFRRGTRSRLFQIVTFVKVAVVLIFISAFPLIIQEGLVEAATSIFFNVIFVTLYLFLDFEGYGLFLACLGVVVILIIFACSSLLRSSFKKNMLVLRYSWSSDDIIHDTKTTVSDVVLAYEADSDASLANIELDPADFDDDNYVFRETSQPSGCEDRSGFQQEILSPNDANATEMSFDASVYAANQSIDQSNSNHEHDVTIQSGSTIVVEEGQNHSFDPNSEAHSSRSSGISTTTEGALIRLHDVNADEEYPVYMHL